MGPVRGCSHCNHAGTGLLLLCSAKGLFSSSLACTNCPLSSAGDFEAAKSLASTVERVGSLFGQPQQAAAVDDMMARFKARPTTFSLPAHCRLVLGVLGVRLPQQGTGLTMLARSTA